MLLLRHTERIPERNADFVQNIPAFTFDHKLAAAQGELFLNDSNENARVQPHLKALTHHREAKAVTSEDPS